MAYIDSEYYLNMFEGDEIPTSELNTLIMIASDIIDSIVQIAITEAYLATYEAAIKKATAYQVQYLYANGGIEAATGVSPVADGASESHEGYSVSGSSEAYKHKPTMGGIPVSPMAIAWLTTKTPLMRRCVYAERHIQDAE